MRLTSVMDRVATLVADGFAPEQVANHLLAALDDKVIRELAREYLIDAATTAVRITEYRARREAATAPAPKERHGNKRTYERGCRCDQCVSWVEFSDRLDREHVSRVAASVGALLETYKAEVKAEWTAELLASTFGTPDGRVTWAAATVADHEAHIAMDRQHIEGYARDAALHQLAIEEIQSKGGECLADVLQAV